jgi:hypothetical protein
MMRILFLLVILTGCTHLSQTPKVVEFSYAKDLLEKVQNNLSRSPSSLSSDHLSDKSPRRVYFGALYYQYQTFGRYLGKNTDIHFCPQFHHDKLETDLVLFPEVTLYNFSSVADEGRDYFPELAFGKDFSLSDYHSGIKNELQILCEEGVSDNFFKFENLITHFSKKTAFHRDPRAMVSLLKIPVFANFYLVKMFQISHLAHISSEEKRFIKMSQTHWFEHYVAEASRLRSHFIKNKMVKR